MRGKNCNISEKQDCDRGSMFIQFFLVGIMNEKAEPILNPMGISKVEFFENDFSRFLLLYFLALYSSKKKIVLMM